MPACCLQVQPTGFCCLSDLTIHSRSVHGPGVEADKGTEGTVGRDTGLLVSVLAPMFV